MPLETFEVLIMVSGPNQGDSQSQGEDAEQQDQGAHVIPVQQGTFSLGLSTEDIGALLNHSNNPLGEINMAELRSILRGTPYPRVLVDRYISVVEANGSIPPRNERGSGAFGMDSVSEEDVVDKILKDSSPEQASDIAKHYAKAILRGATDFSYDTDKRALFAFNIVEKYAKTDEILEEAKAYIEKRVASLTNPKSEETLTLSEYGRIPLEKLAEKVLDNDEEVQSLIKQIKSVTSSHDNRKAGPETLLTRWNVAKQIYENTSNAALIRATLTNPSITSLIVDDEIAKAAAIALIKVDLAAKKSQDSYSRTPDNTVFLASQFDLSANSNFTPKEREQVAVRAFQQACYDKAQIIVSRYKPNMTSVANSAAMYHLHEGNLEEAQTMFRQYRASLTDQDYKEIREKLVSIEKRYVEGNQLKMAATVRQRIRAYDHFIKDGLSAETVPFVDLPEGYKGKILILEWRGNFYLRSGADWHKEIYKKFLQELKIRGFSKVYETEKRGGAYLGFNKEGAIMITGKSEDFGECDKELAKALVRSVYGEREIVTKAYTRKSPW